MSNVRTNQIKRLANLILFRKFFLINHWKYYPTKNAKKICPDKLTFWHMSVLSLIINVFIDFHNLIRTKYLKLIGMVIKIWKKNTIDYHENWLTNGHSLRSYEEQIIEDVFIRKYRRANDSFFRW